MGKGGKWSSEEDQVLRGFHELHSGNMAKIEREMGRADCKDRWRILMREDKATETGIDNGKHKWVDEEKAALAEVLKKWVDDEGVLDDQSVDWNEVQRAVRTRDVLQCRRYWSSNGNRCLIITQECTWNRDMDIELVKWLKGIVFTDEANIDWKLAVGAVTAGDQPVTSRICKSRWDNTLSKRASDDVRKSWNGMLWRGVMSRFCCECA